MTKGNQYDHQFYLKKLHQQFNTPHEVIVEIIKKIDSAGIRSIKRIIAGEVNEVYRITRKGQQELILRIAHKEQSSFEIEKWALEACEKVGVPVPEVLLVDSVKTSGKQLWVCVETVVAGVKLDSILKNPKTKVEHAQALVGTAGGTLAKIHSIKTRGFGNFTAPGQGQKLRPEQWVTAPKERLQNIVSAAKSINYAETNINKAFDILEQHKGAFNQVEPVLAHGDFGSDHIFIKGGKVSGVIDMEGCESGHPVIDFAWWDFYFGMHWPTEWLQAGYSDKTVFDATFDLKLHIAKLRMALYGSEYYWQKGNKAFLKTIYQKFDDELTYFRSLQ
ncbi:phosphotransferase [Candidatus Microgenomates bacterium]|nr:phosphotransferase [Candidatus Microgenomates bacterium]